MKSKVLQIVVGRKLVGITAYCPTDSYGQYAEDFLLEKIRSALSDTFTEDEFRAWLQAKHPADAEYIFRVLEQGGTLPKLPAWAISGLTPNQDARIAGVMKAEHDHGNADSRF